MLISKGTPLLRLLNNKGAINNVRNMSGGVWRYRQGPVLPHPTLSTWLANIGAGFMWWWVFWHLWHEPDHITGEFPYPDPSKWTDAELGIPAK